MFGIRVGKKMLMTTIGHAGASCDKFHRHQVVELEFNAQKFRSI